MKQSIFCLLIAAVILACQPGDNKTSETVAETTVPVKDTAANTPISGTPNSELPANLQAYEAEIIRIHDEIMPQMADVNRLIKQLKAANGGNDDVGRNAAIKSLEKVDDFMMTWMREYSEYKDKLPQDQLLPFYNKQLGKITYLKDQMQNAINQANEWLALHPS